MDNLMIYEGKTIKLTDDLGDVYVGFVTDYIYADDNEPEVEGIILKKPIKNNGYQYIHDVEFDAPEIKSIEVID